MDNWQDLQTFVCGRCLYFVAKSENLGRCRRHAPKTGEGWPTVYEADWCGDHKLITLGQRR